MNSEKAYSAPCRRPDGTTYLHTVGQAYIDALPPEERAKYRVVGSIFRRDDLPPLIEAARALRKEAAKRGSENTVDQIKMYIECYLYPFMVGVDWRMKVNCDKKELDWHEIGAINDIENCRSWQWYSDIKKQTTWFIRMFSGKPIKP